MDDSSNLLLGGGGVTLAAAIFQAVRIWRRDKQTDDVHERANRATDGLLARVSELEQENKDLRAENKQLAKEIGQLQGRVEALQTLLNTQVRNLDAGYRRLKRENSELRAKLGLEIDPIDDPIDTSWAGGPA